jgi:TonB family protein
MNSARVYDVSLCKNVGRSVVRSTLCAILDVLSQLGNLVAGGFVIAGQPYSNSDLHWPKASSNYDTPPKLISGNSPVYPMSQSRSGNPGFAVVAFAVGQNGRTHDIRVVQASYPYFGSHAVLAVRDWKFQPARKNGKTVSMKVQCTSPLNRLRHLNELVCHCLRNTFTKYARAKINAVSI